MATPFFCEDIMSSDTCPTVVIETVNGPVVLNESEFDPAVHKLYNDKSKLILEVVEQDGMWFVVQNDGSLAENSATAGYKTKAMAEKALGLLANA